MTDIPTTKAIAEYRGQRHRIIFSSADWVALHAEPGVEIPDGFATGEAPLGRGFNESWVKVPRSVLDGLLHIRVSGKFRGHSVTLQTQFPDDRIGIEFVGPPSVARELGLNGDRYSGWTGTVTPDQLTDVSVEETRRA